ncbi:MAG: hypothetical protein VW867_00180 [Gammaproteobacteria bacterium]|jgi:hypothetical protein
MATVDDYLGAAGSLDKALLPLGFLLAFCAQHQLLSQQFTSQYAQQLSAVRLQEGRVSSLFAAHGAMLNETDFTPAGAAFVGQCLPRLADDFAQTFGPDCYQIEDHWENYQQLAQVLVRRLRGAPVRRCEGGGFLASLARRVKTLWS